MASSTIDKKAARKSVATAGRFYLPTRPYSLVDAVNRAAASTGSVRYAQLAANSDYNGHNVGVTYNDYRDYCICEHYFGERVVHARGSMEQALRAGKREYDMGHRGTSVHTCALTPEEADVAVSLGYLPWSEEDEKARNAEWYTELHGCVGEAINDGRFGCDTIHLLLKAKNKVDYHELKARDHANQVFGKDNWKECRITGPAGERGLVLSGNHTRTDGEYAMVLVDGDSKMSGPTESARKWWREQLEKGWKAS